MDIIITTESQLSEIVAKELEKYFSAKESQQPVTLPLKQGNYSSKDLLELLQLKSPVSLWQMEKKGLLHPVIIQRKKFYLKEDIEKLIKQKTLNKRA